MARPRIVGGALVALALVVAACGGDETSDGSTPTSAADADADAGYFFSQQAAEGSLAEGELVLREVSPSVLAIADRPMRTVDHLDLGAFVDEWSDRFGDDPPNAVLAAGVGGEERDLAVELMDPSLDESGTELRYRVAVVGDAELPTGEITGASLFIDPAPVDRLAFEVAGGGDDTGRVEIPDDGGLAIVRDTADGRLEVALEEPAPGREGALEVRNETDEEIVVRAYDRSVQVERFPIRPQGELFWRLPG